MSCWGFRVKTSDNIVHLLSIFDRAGVQYSWPAGQKQTTINLSPYSPEMTYPGETSWSRWPNLMALSPKRCSNVNITQTSGIQVVIPLRLTM